MRKEESERERRGSEMKRGRRRGRLACRLVFRWLVSREILQSLFDAVQGLFGITSGRASGGIGRRRVCRDQRARLRGRR